MAPDNGKPPEGATHASHGGGREDAPRPDSERAERAQEEASQGLELTHDLHPPRTRGAYSSFYQRSFVIATVLIIGYLLVRVLEPLAAALGWAAVLAFLLYPVQTRLSRNLKGKRALSAAILTVLTPFCV